MDPITDKYGATIEVAMGDAFGGRVYVGVRKGETYVDVSLTPKQARKLRKALKAALREVTA